MKVLYRISDNGYKKVKFERATKIRCLGNLLTQFPWSEVHVYHDHCIPETLKLVTDLTSLYSVALTPINGGSSAGSWRIVRDEALKLPDDEIVYFCEDDYWHLDGSRKALLEGLERADYVTLYDAPDKYIPASQGGNPFIGDDGADDTRVIRTASTHWRLTNSTTMTFATKVGTLREDNELWKQYTEGTHPNDFHAFLALRAAGRSLLSPIPSLSTHCEPAWAAPLIDWNSII